jgi:hypothetical protein
MVQFHAYGRNRLQGAGETYYDRYVYTYVIYNQTKYFFMEIINIFKQSIAKIFCNTLFKYVYNLHEEIFCYEDGCAVEIILQYFV